MTMAMLNRIHHVTTVIRSITQLTNSVSLYELVDPDGWELPPFEAGSHIDVHISDRTVRPYSLCGDPDDPYRYLIAVQREEKGRGGSLSVHREWRVGRGVSVSLPRNNFGLAPAASSYIFLAGGIGITPFMSMIPTLARQNITFELHYCSRERDAAPFADKLDGYSKSGLVNFHYSQRPTAARLDLDALLRGARRGSHVYCCGPAGFVQAAEVAARNEGLSFHKELFGGATAAAGSDDSLQYEVSLARSGFHVSVRAGQTMLSALRGAGVELDASCEAGVCLRCKTRFLSGTPIHKDLVMSENERAQFLTPCVSGCIGNSLTLDL